jgi:hypothetical protein
MTIEMDFRLDPAGAVRGDRPRGRQKNPSARHQALLELMKLFPETPLRLVAGDLQLGYPVRGPLLARAGDTDAHGLRIDARLEYYAPGEDGSPEVVIALVVEAQLSGEADLRWRLCQYVGYVSHDCRCATDIVIICQTRELARKLAHPVVLGARGSVIVPLAVRPDEIPVISSMADAAADPGRLVLSGWFHTRRGAELREALVGLLTRVTELLYEIDQERPSATMNWR